MFPRSQQAAIQRAEECKVQTISAFGAGHPCAAQAAALVDALTEAAKAASAPKPIEPVPPAAERGPV